MVNGIIKKGTIVNKNDAIIGKVLKLTKAGDDNFQYADRSVIYKDEETAIVHNVIIDRNEEDERFCKVVLRKLRPVTTGDKFCLTSDHEVLTSSGWKNIKDITTDDIVATLDPSTHNVVWDHPIEVFNFEHNDKVYHVKNTNIELITTLNHKMYFREKNSEYMLDEAQNIMGEKVYYKKNGFNTKDDLEIFKLPRFIYCDKNGKLIKNYESRDLDMNLWLVFLGIYMAEGWTDFHNNVRIAVHKDRVKNKLVNILSKLNITYKVYKNNEDYFYINDRQIFGYVKQFGKSYDKFLPDWALQLSKNQSKLLLDSMLLGDGYYDPNKGSYEYYTGSKKLADDVQILAFNSEQSANIVIKKIAGEVLEIKGQETKRNTNQYRVYISKYSLNLEPLIGGKRTEEYLEDYNDNVYCITVPNHIFMTRYNDKYCWTGNSARSGLKTSGPEKVISNNRLVSL